MSARTGTAPRMTPPGWLNTLMTVMLRTPGLQRLVGRSTALVTVVGRKSGRRMMTPISYIRSDGFIVLTGHESRQWWRNAQANAKVGLRLAGNERSGTARILRGDDALPYFLAVLEDQRVVAKAHGVVIDDEGHADPDSAMAGWRTASWWSSTSTSSASHSAPLRAAAGRRRGVGVSTCDSTSRRSVSRPG